MEGDGYTIHFNADGEAIIDSRNREGYDRGMKKLKEMTPAFGEYYKSGSHGKKDNKQWTPDKGFGDKYGLADVAGRHDVITKTMLTFPAVAYNLEKATRNTPFHVDPNEFLRKNRSSKLKKKLKKTKSKKNKKKLKKTKSKSKSKSKK